MATNLKNKNNKERGAAMLIAVVFFLFISLAVIAGLVSPALREFRAANVNYNSKQSYYLAESGAEDAMYRLIKSMNIGSSAIVSAGGGSATTTITSIGSTQKQLVSLGNVSSYNRKISSILNEGSGTVFKYGTQSGQGGFIFHNNASLLGSLYSNGNIVGANGAYITGDAYVAGSSGSISGMQVGFGGTGDAHAHTVTNSTVTGTIYCQSGTGNNSPCNTSQADPTSIPLPISSTDISGWENDATNGGVSNGSVTVSSPTSIGPEKIVGNLTISSTLTVTGTIYVTGNVILNINSAVKLNSAYGSTSGIIIADGYINIGNGVTFQNSGTNGSYIMFLSNSSCSPSISTSPCNSNAAITVSNNSNISIVNAQNGTVYFSNNASVKEVVGNTVELKNNVSISYGSGITANFSTGPGGAWIVGSWGESI